MVYMYHQLKISAFGYMWQLDDVCLHVIIAFTCWTYSTWRKNPSCWILPFLINRGSTTTTVHLGTYFPPCKVRTSSTCLNNCIKVAIELLRSFSSQFCVGTRWSGITMAAHVDVISVLFDPCSYNCSYSTVISSKIYINQWINILVVHIRIIITLL